MSNNLITLFYITNKSDHVLHYLVGGLSHVDFMFTQVRFNFRLKLRVKQINKPPVGTEWFELSVHKEIRISFCSRESKII